MNRETIKRIVTVESSPVQLTDTQLDTVIKFIEKNGIEQYFNSNLRPIIKGGGFEIVAARLEA